VDDANEFSEDDADAVAEDDADAVAEDDPKIIIVKKRKPSERIAKLMKKKYVGPGSDPKEPVELL
jgi:hypothetical protein